MDTITEPPSKRMRLAYHHRHKLQYSPQDLPPHEPSVLPLESIDKLFINGLKTICEEEALKQGINDPVIESVALEALRNAAEEFTLKLCAKVRRSMFAARRTVPIAPDFATAIDCLDLPRPDDQIHPYQTAPVINPTLPPTPPPDDPFHTHIELPASFLGPELSKQDDLKKFTFNITSLPPLPSAHTYKDSAVYTVRETDSRKIRELATEEGKLGEQALRKLATAVKLDTALSTEPEVNVSRAKRGPRARQVVVSAEAVFDDTIRDLLQSSTNDFELGPIVTSEKAYRMPDDTRIKRRPATATVKGGTATGGNLPNKYNLLPPPLKKQSSSAVPVDRMNM